MPQNNLKLNEEIHNPKLRELFDRRAAISADGKDVPDKKVYSDIMGEIADELIMRAKLLVPVSLSKEPESRENGELFVSGNTDVTFMMLTSHDQHFLPVFTDTDDLKKWKMDKVPYAVTMGFDNAASMLESIGKCDGVAVNPFSDDMVIGRQLVLHWYEQKQIMTQGHANHVITGDTPVEMFVPNPYPLELSNKLCETARQNHNVNKIWLRGIKLNGEDGYLLVVDFKGDRQKLFSAFGECARPFLGAKALHIIALDDGFGGRAVENAMPIYSKE